MKLVIPLVACVLAAPAIAQSSLPQASGCLDHPSIECAPQIRVINGDTFEMDGEVIRLWGIDAAERDQVCPIPSRPGSFLAGASATFNLDWLTSGEFSCERLEYDYWGRTIAICTRSDGRDIARLMVEWGTAYDYPEYSNGHYADAQRLAQNAGLGFWNEQYDCIPPWEWREGNRG